MQRKSTIFQTNSVTGGGLTSCPIKVSENLCILCEYVRVVHIYIYIDRMCDIRLPCLKLRLLICFIMLLSFWYIQLFYNIISIKKQIQYRFTRIEMYYHPDRKFWNVLIRLCIILLILLTQLFYEISNGLMSEIRRELSLKLPNLFKVLSTHFKISY